MLANVAARIFPRCARFGAKAGCKRGQTQRELRFGKDLLADGIGQTDFGGGYQPAPVGGLKIVFGEFGQLSGAKQRLFAHQQGRRAFGVTVFHSLLVKHELAKRALQPRHLAA